MKPYKRPMKITRPKAVSAKELSALRALKADGMTQAIESVCKDFAQ